MPDQLWIADWNGRADDRLDATCAATAGCRTGACTSTAAATTRPTAASRSTSTATGSTSAAARDRAASRALRRRRVLQLRRYPVRGAGDSGALVKTLQCLLRRSRALHRRASTACTTRDVGAAVRRYRASTRASPPTAAWARGTWVALLSQGSAPLLKYGAASTAVRRLQRALNAADARRA